MSDLLAKAKKKAANEKLADLFMAKAKRLTGAEQEAFVAAAEFTALENASYDAFILLPSIADHLRSQAPKKVKKSAKQERIEQAIVKTFRENPHLVERLGDLDAVAREGIVSVLEKHLKGEHDQDKHNPHKDKEYADQQATNPALKGVGDGLNAGTMDSLSFKLKPGEGAESLALFLRMPEGLATRIGDMGARVNNFLNNKSGDIGRRVWSVASDLGDSVLTGTPIGRAVRIGQLINQHGPSILRGGLRNYYRFSGNERPIPSDLGKPGQGRDATRNAVIAQLESRLPSEDAARRSSKYAPSEGYIIDSEGNVTAAAIGRGGRVGDRPTDHYTPYALSQLQQVKGGSLVRRRMWGGPTEEDIRLGLLLGANDITTVSNTGRYTVQLSGEGQGVNSELPLILNRLTELRGKNTNHNKTTLALESLSAEFPVHFQAWNAENAKQRGGGNSHEDGLREDGFLTGLLDGWQDSLFGEGDKSSSGGGATSTKPTGSVPGSERTNEVGDQSLHDQATGNAKPVRPPDNDSKLFPVSERVVDDHQRAEGAALRDDMPESSLDDIQTTIENSYDSSTGVYDASKLGYEEMQGLYFAKDIIDDEGLRGRQKAEFLREEGIPLVLYDQWDS